MYGKKKLIHLNDRSLVRALCKFRISLCSYKVNLLHRSKGKYFVDTDGSSCNSGGIEDEFMYFLFVYLKILLHVIS